MAGEVVTCKFCMSAGSVPKADLAAHVQSEHEGALFGCGFCEADDGKFETLRAAADHIRVEHKIKKEAIVNKALRVPYVEFLRSYTCAMCDAQFIGTTEEKLFQVYTIQ